jgi:hypothetical protein
LYAQLASINTFSGGSSGAQGGILELLKGSSGMTGNLRIAINGSQVRFYDAGGSQNGAYIDLSTADAAIGSKIALINSSIIGDQISTSLATGVSASSTIYAGIGATSSTQASVYVPAGYAFTAKSIKVRTGSGQPASGSLTIELYKGSSATGLIATVPVSGTQAIYSDTGSVSFAVNDLINFKIINNATATSAIISGITIGIERVLT